MDALFIVEEWRFILELLCAEFIFVTPSARKRPWFVLRAAAGVAVCMAIALLYWFIWEANITVYAVNMVAHIGWYIFMTACSMVCMVFCYRISPGWLLFCGIAGYALQHVEYVAVNEIFALGICPQILGNVPLYIALIAGTYAAVCVCAALIFRPKLKALGDIPFAKKPVALCFYSLLLAMLIASAFMAQMLFHNGGGKPVQNPNYIAGIADIFNCVFVLIIMYASLNVRERDRRNDIINQMLIASAESYRVKKETIDIINSKCHDLKHQIGALRTLSPEEQQSRIDEIEKRIMFYDLSVDTGNEVINTMIAEKMLYCTENNIRLYVSGNGKKLGFMDTVDLFTLLGNALDNAVESVMRFNSGDRRVINFAMEEQGDIMLIRMDNYYEGEISFVNCLPRTSKGDNYYHVFGLSSIRKIAEKYDGGISIGTDGGIFTLQIVLPVPAAYDRLKAEE